MVHVTASFAEKVWTAVEFSGIDLALVAAPAAPLGPVMTGATSSMSVTVTVTTWAEIRPAASVARTVRTYVLFPAPAPRSVGVSKSGAELKLRAPPAVMLNFAASVPVIVQVTGSLAENVWTAVEFSGIDLALVAAPAAPLGPVMSGAMS